MLIRKNAFTTVFIILSLFTTDSFAQYRHTVKKKPVPAKTKESNKSPQINLSFNRIFNGSLGSFYEKLAALKKGDTGVVRVVHIGDSHIQADFLSSVVRIGLQQSFGNAGRGLVFPYQVANSNAPSDINSFSNIGWQYNRLAHQEIGINTGVSGFCIQTNNPGASVNFSLKPNENGDQSFNKIKFFTNNVPGSKWELQAGSDSLYTFTNDSTNAALYKEVMLDKPVNECVFSCLSGDSTNCFYGASLENSKPGILYHTIGVNGARYDQYNATPLFWKQLPALKADLFIVSLGTNDAQGNSFNAASFENEVNVFVNKLRTASPGAAILITTAADSYKGKRSNVVLKQLNIFLSNYCAKNHIALWDLYRVTNGYGAARYWLRKGLMNNDRVHYLPEGYKIHGSLLLDVLKKGYQSYSSPN